MIPANSTSDLFLYLLFTFFITVRYRLAYSDTSLRPMHALNRSGIDDPLLAVIGIYHAIHNKALQGFSHQFSLCSELTKRENAVTIQGSVIKSEFPSAHGDEIVFRDPVKGRSFMDDPQEQYDVQ